jgi:membrane-bound metal-dependent hydrolase YbcI (DUF457 family)
MTFVGHMLTGASIAAVAAPRRLGWLGRGATMAVFAVLAIAPDLDWHGQYRVRHSLLVNLGLIAGAALLAGAWGPLRRRIGGWTVLAAGAAAWLSHLLLDSFYNHGRGINLGWPAGELRLNLPIPWFATMRPPLTVTPHNIRVWAIEALCYGPLLAGCLLLRWCIDRRGGAPQPNP